MKAVRAVLLIGGLLVLAALVARVGIQSVMSVLNRLAWWQLVLACIPYGLIMAVDTLGWRYAFLAKPPPYLRMLAARTAGEAINIVTALGSVGGEAVKVWLLRPAVSYHESVPSVVVAKTTSTIAQALLLLLGLVLAITTITVAGDVIWAMLGLLGVERPHRGRLRRRGAGRAAATVLSRELASIPPLGIVSLLRLVARCSGDPGHVVRPGNPCPHRYRHRHRGPRLRGALCHLPRARQPRRARGRQHRSVWSSRPRRQRGPRLQPRAARPPGRVDRHRTGRARGGSVARDLDDDRGARRG